MNVVHLIFYNNDMLRNEWLGLLGNSEFIYECCEDVLSYTSTQEWLRCEGDSSVNIVNVVNHRIVLGNTVNIYIDETLVCQFHHYAGRFELTDGTSNRQIASEVVRSNVLEFINKWNIGVC
ncbi:hypothetical protein Xoosp13_144 [Xanthomonas phage Xoo-sp13]|nr:hypothetical protein Xoosp13_144 [Xanthomonas phage Xoo-sp13]